LPFMLILSAAKGTLRSCQIKAQVALKIIQILIESKAQKTPLKVAQNGEQSSNLVTLDLKH